MMKSRKNFLLLEILLFLKIILTPREHQIIEPLRWEDLTYILRIIFNLIRINLINLIRINLINLIWINMDNLPIPHLLLHIIIDNLPIPHLLVHIIIDNLPIPHLLLHIIMDNLPIPHLLLHIIMDNLTSSDLNKILQIIPALNHYNQIRLSNRVVIQK